uniref:DNA polymerase kappa n=1 Tax=Rhodosorus marinus TaxID=101924 RepID=A0A7S3A6R9_9RHOD|mmetsp:Transcript_5527/g.23444  ORF Transcript_5527/g.23444 Transcript_5527/m.23444 type:complete len:768 (+) Transcript_5527:128-2431(+)
MWMRKRKKDDEEEQEKEEKWDWDGGDFGVYMKEKERKLREQHEADLEAEGGESGFFFKGVVVWVDGFTNPGRDELRRMVYKGGGKLETYFHPRIVTHVVATHFPKFKIVHLQKAMMSNQVHQYVVTPDWIVKSLSQKRRLPESEFLVPGLRDETQSVLNLAQRSGSTELSAGRSMGKTSNPEPASVVAGVGTDVGEDTDPDKFAEKLLHKSTRENPNFVRDYFSASRLHFIGSFRARYESLIAAVAMHRGCSASDLLRTKGTTKENGVMRSIIHIDMDCFFVSVAVAKDPSLAGIPLVVCHQHGGEISSASYEAREKGVRAGMFFREAVKLCPELKIVTYRFEDYERVTFQIYCIFYELSPVVEAVSVDEAFLDVTDADLPQDILAAMPELSNMPPAERIALTIRRRIAEETGCPSSAGIGANKLLARLATKRAKPNGQFYLSDEEAVQYVADLPVRDLPGVGWSTGGKLQELGVERCDDLQRRSLSQLQALVGEKNGESLYRACRGQDDKQVQPMKVRKSLGAEASWGVRFYEDEGLKMHDFVRDLAAVVSEKLQEARAVGQRITIKVYWKMKNASLPHKTLGHGPCDIYNRSVKTERTSDAKTIAEKSIELLNAVKIPPQELRGLGIQVHDLVFLDIVDSSGSNIARFLKQSSTSVGGSTASNPASAKIPSPKLVDSSSLPSGWDESVFRSLPKHVQQEVLEEHRQNQRQDQRARSAGRTSTKSETRSENAPESKPQKKTRGGSRQASMLQVRLGSSTIVQERNA